jgi:hypothetical protein
VTRNKKKEVVQQTAIDISSTIAANLIAPVDRNLTLVSLVAEDKKVVNEKLMNAIIICESENPKIRKVVDFYHPANWVYEYSQGRYYMKGRVRRDLLRLWTVAVDSVLSIWLEIRGQNEIAWKSGFIFSDDVEAMYLKRDYDVFLLNPVSSDGTMKYKLTKKEDWANIVTEAIHEVTHIGRSCHDEDFAGKMTDLTKKVMGNIKKIFARIKLVLASE